MNKPMTAEARAKVERIVDPAADAARTALAALSDALARDGELDMNELRIGVASMALSMALTVVRFVKAGDERIALALAFAEMFADLRPVLMAAALEPSSGRARQ